MNKTPISEPEARRILAQNLRFLRRCSKQRISQKAFARILRFPLKTIRNYESGRTSPLAYDVYRLSVYYGYTMEELLTEKLYEERKN